MPIPTEVAELPPTGILGLCVNIATIVHVDVEDPVECLIMALTEVGIDFTCFPGAYSRETERLKERLTNAPGFAIHRF